MSMSLLERAKLAAENNYDPGMKDYEMKRLASLLQANKSAEETSGADDDEKKKALAVLKEDCERIWASLRNSLKNRQNTAPGSLAGGSRATSSQSAHVVGSAANHKLFLLQAKAARLQAELTQMNESSAAQSYQSEPLEVVKVKAVDQVHETIARLEETLASLSAELRNVQEKIARQEEITAQHAEINATLRHQQEMSSAMDTQGSRGSSAISEVNAKTKLVADYNRKLMKSLGDFVSQHFPPLEQAALVEDDGEPGGVKKRKYMPLATLLESLLNTFASKPHDPYIPITRIHYEPYIELLVRSGIAVRHPQNAQLLRLNDFIS